MHPDRENKMAHAPARRSMLRAFIERLRGRAKERSLRNDVEQGRHYPGEPVILSEEGSREVLDEIRNGSPRTPERRETFALMREMSGVRRHRPGAVQPAEQTG